jgi:uncharacterized protein YndB with AHSA1/START domain
MSRRSFRATADIEAPPAKVFAVLWDVERWPEWTPTVTAVRRLDSGPFTVGSTARVRQPKLRDAVWRVTDLDPARSFTWVTSAPGLRMSAGHSLGSRGNGTHAELSFEMSGFLSPLMSRLYGRLIQEYVTTEALQLKKRSESVVPVSA